MLLYGAGGHAKVIASILFDSDILVEGIFDDDLSKLSIHSISMLGSYRADFQPNESIIISIGNNEIRSLVSKKIQHPFGIAIHKTALIDKSCTIEKGTVIMHRAVLQADTKIGKHVIVNTSASIDHDCKIADFVHIAPGVVICGNVQIGEKTLVGVGSILVPNIKIGKNCLITAGSVVTQNIPDNSITRGNPARLFPKNDLFQN
jgi:sugar O-acyltransferase (sialic acid O-acetyltransferase NeuD family)